MKTQKTPYIMSFFTTKKERTLLEAISKWHKLPCATCRLEITGSWKEHTCLMSRADFASDMSDTGSLIKIMRKMSRVSESTPLFSDNEGIIYNLPDSLDSLCAIYETVPHTLGRAIGIIHRGGTKIGLAYYWV